MDNITFTETGIIALVTILVSLISTILNIWLNVWSKKHDTEFQTSQKQFELYYSEKSKIFEDFVAKAPLIITYKESLDRYDSYYTSALKVILFCGTKPRDLINKLLSFTNTALLNGMKVDRTWETSYLQQLSDITMLLNEELKATSDVLFTKPRRYTRLQKQLR